MTTGSGRLPKPSLGSWVLYGLGTENQSLPGYVSMGGGSLAAANVGVRAFFPACTREPTCRADGQAGRPHDRERRNPILNQAEQPGRTRSNSDAQSASPGASEHETRLKAQIQSFELAFRMQTEASNVFDVSDEPKQVAESYGTSQFGTTLLMARRLAEAGVRVVQVFHQQDAITTATFRRTCRALPANAINRFAGELLADLQRRGLGRHARRAQGAASLAAHRATADGASGKPKEAITACFSMSIAGGGVKTGTNLGETDEFRPRHRGTNPRPRSPCHDLHLLGSDHQKLTYRCDGPRFLA